MNEQNKKRIRIFVSQILRTDLLAHKDVLKSRNIEAYRFMEDLTITARG